MVQRQGLRVIRLAPRVVRLTPGGLITGLITQLAARELGFGMQMWMNGLSLVQVCAVLPTDSWSGASGCATGQARGIDMKLLPNQVRGMLPGDKISFLGFTHQPGGVDWRGRVTQIWEKTGLAPNSRPFYLPNPYPVTVPSPLAPVFPPGRVPFDVRPWPAWRGVPHPPAPRPQADPAPRPDPRYRWSGNRWTFDGTNNPPRTNPITGNPRRPPRANEQEVKLGASPAVSKAFFAVMRAREALSEYMDFLDVLFESLPDAVQKAAGGDKAPPHKKMAAVVDHLGEIDGYQFIKNYIANHLEDEIIGRTWFKGMAKVRNSVFGNRHGTVQPALQPLFDEYTKRVAGLADRLADHVMGDTDWNHERSVEKLTRDAERALQNLANHPLLRDGQPRPRNE